MAKTDPIDINKIAGYTGFKRKKGSKAGGRSSPKTRTPPFVTLANNGNPYGVGTDMRRTPSGTQANPEIYNVPVTPMVAPPYNPSDPFRASQTGLSAPLGELNASSLAQIMAQSAGGGGGGGGGGNLTATQDPATGGTGDPDLDPWSGWAGKNYMPGSQSLLDQNPGIIIRDTLKEMGFDPDSGMMDLIASDADSLQYLSMLTQGMAGENSGNADDVFNFYNKWAKGQGTVGGGVLDPNQLLDNILNAPKGSALESMLKNASTSDINNLVQAAVMGKSSIYRNAIMDNLGDTEQDWLSDQARNKKSPILVDYLKKKGFYA